MHQCSTTLVKVIFYVKTSNRIANELKDHGEGYSKESFYDETRQITAFDFFLKVPTDADNYEVKTNYICDGNDIAIERFSTAKFNDISDSQCITLCSSMPGKDSEM